MFVWMDENENKKHNEDRIQAIKHTLPIALGWLIWIVWVIAFVNRSN